MIHSGVSDVMNLKYSVLDFCVVSLFSSHQIHGSFYGS
jgi:hypothetical protein